MNKAKVQNITTDSKFEKAISVALEAQQAPAIPADFATRVAQNVATLPQPSRAHRAHYARTISSFFAAALVLGLFILAPHAQPSFASVGFDLELCLTGLLAGLLYWLTQAPTESL